MNDRQRAWQIIHTEIRRRANGTGTDESWAANVGSIIRSADSVPDLIIELAGFGATFALMDGERGLKVADIMGARIMQEGRGDDD